jgi:hypothetical protein
VTDPDPTPAPHQPEESSVSPAPDTGVSPAPTSGVSPGETSGTGKRGGGCLGGAAALLALAVAAGGFAVHLAAAWLS